MKADHIHISSCKIRHISGHKNKTYLLYLSSNIYRTAEHFNNHRTMLQVFVHQPLVSLFICLFIHYNSMMYLCLFLWLLKEHTVTVIIVQSYLSLRVKYFCLYVLNTWVYLLERHVLLSMFIL